jgi:hypothetical protein
VPACTQIAWYRSLALGRARPWLKCVCNGYWFTFGAPSCRSAIHSGGSPCGCWLVNWQAFHRATIAGCQSLRKNSSGSMGFVLWALALCRLLFCKHRHDRILLYVRIQVSVAAALLFSLVTYEIVDDPLVDSLARQGRDERVPENMPAP